MRGHPEVRKRLAEYSGLLHQRAYVANHDGNVSARVGGGFLITPTATSKRLCGPDSMVECDAAGTPIGKGRPPSELSLHVAAYRARKTVGAVIHAHPIHASAFALSHLAIDAVAMPEVVVSIGECIPLVPRLLPKDPKTVETVQRFLEHFDVVLLAGNGVLAVGDDLEQAYLRMELVEQYAAILSASRALGGPAPLHEHELAALRVMRQKAGLWLEPMATAKPAAFSSTSVAAILPIVAEEVRRALGRGNNG